MLFKSADSQFPSVVVEEGQTLTLRAKDARETSLPQMAMQPRTTAALLVMAGQSPSNAPRLSDTAAFEQTDQTDGMVSFSDLDQDGRIGGYSVPFLKDILGGLDPVSRYPPESVKRKAPLAPAKPCRCNCSGGDHAAPAFKASAFTETEARIDESAYTICEFPVPEFIQKLKVVSLFTRLGDIIVGRNATLILDDDIFLAIAENVWAYQGARIFQRATNLNLDVTGVMRGSVTRIFHFTASEVLKVDRHILAAEPLSKP